MIRQITVAMLAPALLPVGGARALDGPIARRMLNLVEVLSVQA